jgi:hypothetical protein
MPALPQPSEPSSRLWPYDSTRREKVVPSAFQISYFGASATQVTQINNNMEQNEEKRKKKKKKTKTKKKKKKKKKRKTKYTHHCPTFVTHLPPHPPEGSQVD